MAIPYSRTVFGGLAWYSVLIVLGIVLAVLLASSEEKRLGLPKDTALDLALIVVPCGIVGARLYYVAMTWEIFAQNPISILYVWEGGVAIYGGIIGGAVGAFIYAKRKRLSFLRLADIVAPGLLVAQAIGRWGNYFNMEAYGPEIKNPLFWFFPIGVLIPQGNEWVWHMATFFYESLWNACGFLALWLLRKKQDEKGNVFCWYLLIYGSGRFIIEQLRQDSLYMGGLRVSQYVSLLLCAVAAVILFWRAARGSKAWFGIAVAVSALLLARWACLGSVWGYAALMILATAGSVWLCIQNGTKRSLWCLAPIFLLDAAGLIFFWIGVPWSTAFPFGAHTLICSLTLPAYVGALTLPGREAAHGIIS